MIPRSQSGGQPLRSGTLFPLPLALGMFPSSSALAHGPLVSHKASLHVLLIYGLTSVFRTFVPVCHLSTLRCSPLQNRVSKLHASECRRVSSMPKVGFSPQRHDNLLSEDESELDVLVRPSLSVTCAHV